VECADAGAANFPGPHKACAFQLVNVFEEAGQGHVVRPGEGFDRCLALTELRDHGAAGGICECSEEVI